VPLQDGPLTPESRPELERAFESVYKRLYGRVAEGVPLEALNWRVVASGPRPTLRLEGEREGGADATPALKGERAIYLPERAGMQFATVPVYDRYRLAPGMQFDGPAVVEERESTAIVGGAPVRVDAHRNLVVAMPGGGDGAGG